MTLHLSPAIEERLDQVARERGVEAASLASDLLASAIESIAPVSLTAKKTVPLGADFFEALRLLPGTVVAQPDETFHRSMDLWEP